MDLHVIANDSIDMPCVLVVYLKKLIVYTMKRSKHKKQSI